MDTVSKEVRSRNMAAIKGRDTKPEMVVRKLLHTNGYRYSLHKKALPGKPDLYLKKYNTVMFIHGCFWHQHPGCKYAVKPKSNIKFWRDKLKHNVERDRENISKLKEMGFNIITLWECEIDRNKTDKLFDRIKKELNNELVDNRT